MSSVTQFKSFLLKKSLLQNKARYTLYNYLDAFCQKEQKLTLELLEEFYRTAFSFSYWQTWSNSLADYIKQELYEFVQENKSFSEELNLEEWKLGAQIITIQNKKDLLDLVKCFMETRASKGDKIQVLDFYSDKVLALTLKLGGNIEAYTFGPAAVMHRGQLEPVYAFSKLHYSQNCELQSACQQEIETSTGLRIHFRKIKNKVQGYECQGPFFRPFNHFQCLELKEHKVLFNALKKIERFFIEPQSDPHYKDLIQSLHKHYRTLLVYSSKSTASEDILQIIEPIRKSLHQAQIAIEEYYPEEPLLVLLTANIEFHLRKAQAQLEETSPAPLSPLPPASESVKHQEL